MKFISIDVETANPDMASVCQIGIAQFTNGKLTDEWTTLINPEGDYYGENIVFTGSLSIKRNQAADLAAKIGCEVTPGVTKNTTMLVVGDQDISRLSGHEKSSKHRKAEALIEKGQSIRIIKESDFMEMISIVEKKGD
ncbi:MAG: BRCT domain-containing protein [Desulfofustis sp.]|jgi:DNA polymerase-3 subunit epsilon|nr:BRCT domain-containing protein [Desulfofustis sp.]